MKKLLIVTLLSLSFSAMAQDVPNSEDPAMPKPPPEATNGTAVIPKVRLDDKPKCDFCEGPQGAPATISNVDQSPYKQGETGKQGTSPGGGDASKGSK
jgi:hypothetical protein